MKNRWLGFVLLVILLLAFNAFADGGTNSRGALGGIQPHCVIAEGNCVTGPL